MGAHDAAPDAAVHGALLLGLSLVHVSDTLAEVELSLGLGHNTVNLEEGGVAVLVGLGTLVTKDLQEGSTWSARNVAG